MGFKLELAGQRFQSLTVLDEFKSVPNKYGTIIYWKCRCDCGNELWVGKSALLRRTQPYCKNCKPVARRNTRLYHIYHGIIQRCDNPNTQGYEHYGGRGIDMCQEWRESYEAFRDWSLEHGYIERAGLSIDRIDNDGNYEPSNCQWISIGANTAKSNYGRQQSFTKLAYIYAIDSNGIRENITNIAKFSRDHNLNYSNVNAIIRGRMPKNHYIEWEFHSPIIDQEGVTTIESACVSGTRSE